MNVIAFANRASSWTPEERRALEALFEMHRVLGNAAEAAIAATDHGDPQFFVLGPAPDYECILSVSRVRGSYVLEDGNGGVLTDTDDLRSILDMAGRLRVRRMRGALAAKGMLAWLAIREYFEEKTDAVVEEAIEAAELLGHFVPQLAVLA